MRDAVLYTKNGVSREFAASTIAKFAEKGISVNELFYGNDAQIAIVEEALNTWRETKGSFTWPFVVYKVTEENGDEGARFVQGEQAIDELVAVLT